MHEIEKELVDITGYQVKRKYADRQDYLKAVFTAVQDLTDEDFDTLTEDAARWANACVEVYNTDKEGDLPDFDEVEPPEDEDDDDEGSGNLGSPDGIQAEDSDEGPETSSDDDQEADGEPEEEIAPVKKDKTPKKPKEAKKAKPSVIDDEEVHLDKWGCMEGSKNSQALALFEKGATAKEVKDAIGGTYYNILRKMVSHGHKLEKSGSLIKLTHLMEKPSKAKVKK